MFLNLIRLDTVTQFHAELTFSKEIFCKNGCPENFIGKCFKKCFINIHLE